ncbi:MAG: glycosyltransferase [Gammaproteobacteria bacterium]
MGERALLLVDDAAEVTRDPMPPGMAAFDYVPHSRILPHAKAIVLAGGIGTTSQALRAGKPLVIVPFAHDQFDNAARVERLGVGLVISRERYTAKRAATALERLLGTPSFARKASDIGRRVQSEDGIAVACDAIEQVLSRSSDRRVRSASPIHGSAREPI